MVHFFGTGRIVLFNSIQFVFFFPLVVAMYFTTPQRWRWLLLLGASYYFYAAWRPEYVVLIFASTVVDYLCGRGMGRFRRARVRKLLLSLSVGTNLGFLFAFKYLSFFNESIRAAFDQFNIFYGVPAFDILLPVGISFYTFQSLSYTIDVYRERTPPEKHFGIFALYVSFFPQLVAGPIERSYRLLPQFYAHQRFDPDRVVSGLRLMLWGFFLKIVVADRLALFVNEVYADPGAYSGSALLLGTYFFAFQIFADFAGYSCIAIGAAGVMGYDLMENFRRPYFAASIREFWGRWHISLSTWFRDYLYIPLGGNRVSRWRWYVNLFAVFVISGLWHGAAWTFVVWGALHGAYLVVSLVTSDLRDHAWRRFAAAVQRASDFVSAVLQPKSAVRSTLPDESMFHVLGFPSPGLRQKVSDSYARFAGRRVSNVATPSGSFPKQEAAGPTSDMDALPRWAEVLRKGIAVLLTFHLVLVAWVFFRAESFPDAVHVLTAMWRPAAGGTVLGWPFGRWDMLLAFGSIAVLLSVHIVQSITVLYERARTASTPVRWGMDYALLFAILLFGEFGAQEFIYFQF